MKLSDYIVTFLKKKGICDLFGYQGTMIAHFVDSIERDPDVRNHSCYNEQGAAFAACGYAQTKKDCACAYSTSGPGAVNLLSGVANAYFDSLPVIFLTGQMNTYEHTGIKGLRQQAFQEIDIVSMAKPVTKYCVQVQRAEDIVEELNKAYHIAMTGRRGPVLLDLPMNIQRAEIEDPVYDMRFEREDDGPALDEAVSGIVEALRGAKRPVILLGNGVDTDQGKEAALRFAEKQRIPVITSALAKSLLPFDHPLSFGCIGGTYGHRYANMIANVKSDLLLCFGISLCTRQTGVKVHEFAVNARLIRVDVDRYNQQRDIHKDGAGESKYCVDASAVLTALEKVPLEPADRSEWLAMCCNIRDTLRRVDDDTPERFPNRVIRALSESLSDAAAVAIDVGQHMVWGFQSFQNRKDQALLFSGGHGAMGYALPAAIGGYYASGKPTACIAGDGAFQMNIQELQWVKRENIPIRMIVMNNASLGLIRQQQKSLFHGLYAGSGAEHGFTSCDFCKVARAYGIEAEQVPGEDVERLAHELLRGSGPKLLEVILPEDTYAYPKTSLGEPIHNQQPYMPKEIYEALLNA